MVRGTLSVTIVVGIPNTTYTTVQNCGSTSITRSTSPPTGVNWYWQTTASGASTTSNAATYSATSGQTVYLRARDITSGTWSSTSQTAGTLSVINALSAPTTATNGAAISSIAVNVSLSVGAVSGATGYAWYLQNTGGTAIAGQTTTNYSPSVNTMTSYYVATINGPCTSSTRKAVTADIYPEPVVAVTNDGIVSMGSSVTLSVSNFTYDSYTWLDENNAVIGSGSSIIRTTAGNYKVRVTKGIAPAFTTLSRSVVNNLSQNNNFIISNNIMVDNVLLESAIATLPVESNNQTIQYFDGLGRLLQTVVTQGSPLKNDIVQPVTYDEFGREVNKYLPYISTLANGWYKTDANTLQNDFYSSPPSNIAQDGMPYTKIVFEDSPLKRVIKQGAPGGAWQPDSQPEQDRSINYSHEVNTDNEVLQFIYDKATGLVNVSSNGSLRYYKSNELFVHKTLDENKHERIEYTDRGGHIICKKIQYDVDVSNPNVKLYASTYYIYDDFGNVVIVLPPEAINSSLNLLSK